MYFGFLCAPSASLSAYVLGDPMIWVLKAIIPMADAQFIFERFFGSVVAVGCASRKRAIKSVDKSLRSFYCARA